MSKIESFEDLIIWQKSKNVFISLHKDFSLIKEFYLRDQLLRAALSISNNIAEGFERQSQKEYIRFLFIAKGSCAEVRSMLHILNELKYLPSNDFESYKSELSAISKMIMTLISRVKSTI